MKIIKAWPEWCPHDHYRSKAGDPGYKVEYENGFISWSPADVFEEAYRRTSGMTFDLAIEAMKKGHSVARKGWDARGVYCRLQEPDVYSKMTSPYIYIDTTGLQTENKAAPKCLVLWLASQTDMLADDWGIV